MQVKLDSMISKEDASKLLKLWRTFLEDEAKDKKTAPAKYPPAFDERVPVIFSVSLDGQVKQFGSHFGFSKIIDSLIEQIPQMSEFVGGKKAKLEVSFITEPVLVEIKQPTDYKEKIKAGDGLMLSYGPYTSFLLPQSSASVEETLDKLCEQAGLAKEMWRHPDVMIYTFAAQTFSE
jgi:hypothetical protein